MKDPRPVFVRIAKLEERLKEKPKARFAFFKDSSRVLSVCAFVVSIVTTTYSWRKDDLQTHEAARREFDSTMQQAVDIGLKTYEFQVKNKDQPNLGAMMGWFNMQTGLLMNKSIQELAAMDDPSMFDYTVVGNIVAHPVSLLEQRRSSKRRSRLGYKRGKSTISSYTKSWRKFRANYLERN